MCEETFEFMYEVIKNNEENKIKIIEIIRELNDDYPIPLSEKINIENYVNKILSYGYVLVAKINQNIVGFTTFYANNYEKKEGAFSLLGVLRPYRKFGVAKQLFKESFNIMRNEGMLTAFSYTHKKNEGGIKFHQSLGFEIDENRITNQEYNISLIKKL